jgi:Flp pilus assembly protein TadD
MNLASAFKTLLSSRCVQPEIRQADVAGPRCPRKPILHDIALAKRHLGSFVVLQAAGDIPGALKAASAACYAAPTVAQCHYAYGQAWSARGDHAQAERAFAETVRLKPDWADAWVNYGIARYHQGAVNDAKLALRQALRHAPEHVAAAANLGAFLRLTGVIEAGEAMLRDALVRNPANVAARLNLVAELLQEERAGEMEVTQRQLVNG